MEKEEIATKQKEQEDTKKGIFTAKEKVFEKVKVPENVYEAVYKGHNEIPDGKHGTRIVLEFEFLVKSEPTTLGAVVYSYWSEKSKLAEVLKGLGVDFVAGKTVELDKLVGTACKIVVEDYQDNDGDVRSIVTKVIKINDESKVNEEIVE